MSEAARAAALELLPPMIFARRDRLARYIVDAIEDEATYADTPSVAVITRLASIGTDEGREERFNLAVAHGLNDEWPFADIEAAIRAAASAFLQGVNA